MWQFKMVEGCHVFCSKSYIKGLGMSYVIGWFFCLWFRFLSTRSQLIASDGIRSRIRRKRNCSDPCNSDSIELRIANSVTVFCFCSYWNRRFLTLLILTPLPIPSTVWTGQKKCTCIENTGENVYFDPGSLSHEILLFEPVIAWVNWNQLTLLMCQSFKLRSPAYFPILHCQTEKQIDLIEWTLYHVMSHFCSFIGKESSTGEQRQWKRKVILQYEFESRELTHLRQACVVCKMDQQQLDHP